MYLEAQASRYLHEVRSLIDYPIRKHRRPTPEPADANADAEAAWVEAACERRWSLFVMLSFAWQVSEITAEKHVERWAVRLRRRLPGAAVMVGLHTDQGRIHAHALVFVPRRGASRNKSSGDWLRGCSTTWHQTLWKHGLIWLDRFSSERTAHAAEYSFREVGTVMQIGTAPPAQALR